MAMSLDGKIATKERGPVKLGSRHDTRRMAEIRAAHDVVLNGAATFKAYPLPLVVNGADLLAARRRRGLGSQPASAIASSRLRIPRGTPWERATQIERWAFCGKAAPAAAVQRLEAAGVRVVRGRGERAQPKEILQALAQAGKERLLLEGGGELNAAFLELGLVDKIHLTLTPLLIGGAQSPTWCEGKGFKKFPRFRLGECRPFGDELYLTYGRA
jgi:riboflavin-specific deaminase-like protein